MLHYLFHNCFLQLETVDYQKRWLISLKFAVQIVYCSTDSKRSQVRTIEVRPMAQQQPKQPTATVMPTTSQSEAQEATPTGNDGELATRVFQSLCATFPCRGICKENSKTSQLLTYVLF